MKKSNYIFIALSLVFIGILIVISYDNVEVNQKTWKCIKEENGNFCEVEFKIKNNNYYPVESNIFIRAHKREHNGKGAVSNKVAGEKILKLTLNPSEEKTIKNKFKVYRSVDNVNISTVNDRK